ncbi:MAG: MBL fold metallo-hydrolase [Sphingomonadaceae bacterium]|nr:MBL fold metallo-hydrolase [Sphingomonadaceae bacterium]
MTLTLTVHRGTQQIGGSCIEIEHEPSGERLILDAGRPLDAPEGATGLLPETLDRERPATVLISHPHQDHWGLINELPPGWPVRTGAKSAALIEITGDYTRQKYGGTLKTWDSRSGPIALGAFTVTPYLTDHSALDAYMLLIEGGAGEASRRVLYTGDFRRHGRKSALVDSMMANPPANVHALLMEGTNLRSDKPVISETELEREFVDLFRRTGGRVFLSWSGQNIDRTVTIYRAARLTGRTLAIDLYVADVLERIAEGTGLPRPGFPNLKVVITSRLASWLRKRGRGDFVSEMAPHGVSADKLASGNWVVMLRRSLIGDFTRRGVTPRPEDAFVFSMWRGNLDEPYHAEARDWCANAGAEIVQIHTSGHAAPADLAAFATAIDPRWLVPVHGVKWDDPGLDLPPVKRLGDGERWTVP